MSKSSFSDFKRLAVLKIDQLPFHAPCPGPKSDGYDDDDDDTCKDCLARCLST